MLRRREAYPAAVLALIVGGFVIGLATSDPYTLGFDLEQLVRAADAVVHGTSPYDADHYLPYPPLTAWLVSPLLLLSPRG